jgi:Tfp pilus assembly protein PilF
MDFNGKLKTENGKFLGFFLWGAALRGLLLCVFAFFPCVEAYSDGDDGWDFRAREGRRFDYFFLEGVKLKNEGKFDASFDMFKHCLSIDSTSAAALFEIASYNIQMNRPESAVSIMKKAVSYAPHNDEYRTTLAVLMFNLGMFGEAVDEYEVLAAAHPEKHELSYYLAESYTRTGEIGKAIDTYDNLESVMGMHEAISMEKFSLYMGLSQPDMAVAELERLSEKFSTEARYMIMLGDIALQDNKMERALAYFAKANETDPQSPHYPVSMANYYERIGENDSARMQINNALTNSRLDVDTKVNIITRYIMQQQRARQGLDGANELFRTLIDQHPDDTRLRLSYGELLASQGKVDEARFNFTLVTEIEPENEDAWQFLLRLSFHDMSAAEVLDLCKRASETFPTSLEFAFYLGIAYYQVEMYELAIVTYRGMIEMGLDDNPSLASDVHAQIGDAFFSMGIHERAFEYYEEALRLNERNVAVLNNYAYYLALTKTDLTKAERMSAQSLKLDPDNATYIDTYAWIFFVQGNYTLAKLYIEQALAKDASNNPELIDHYGDILYMSGEKERAVEQWVKARDAGKQSPILDRKIADGVYIEEIESESIGNE